ncbi:hypothetical protein CC1G_09829 [Coprinopsis cinerea okayama7|uniref:Transmembrane protein n=1 Tax=Coprinopsis cinerea (strain Okayama-7 / 130 / ATCC MYA-4618 / FGSC 9003) TaxID=240176 RepID=A8P0A8_COPC7|nr:hypothetical protein CC1G_09829 [Coprinopsis cinerea okayama7\|eukprot:XP_001837847.1 hypothetical protein CC1G_09829 [Coprinopsis cinerea okayama7\
MAEPQVTPNPMDVDVERGRPQSEEAPEATEATHVQETLEEKPLPDPWPEPEETIEMPKPEIIEEVPVISKPVEPTVHPKDLHFQELQKELADFLGQHIHKVVQLQTSLVGGSNSIRPRFARSDKDGDTMSGRASTGHFAVFSHMDLAGTRPTPMDIHLFSLDQFLTVHLENVNILQETLKGNVNGLPAPQPLSTIAETMIDSSSQYNSQMQQFAMLAITSILMSLFILAFLGLSYALIEPRHRRIPFSVSLLFALLCLGPLLLTIALSLWGIMSASWRRMRNMPESALQSHFHLHLGRQIQFCVSVAMFLPVVILAFYIFAAIAFPIVFLVLLLVASLLVVGSVFYRVPITFENVSTLILGTKGLERPNKQKRPAPRSRRSFY